MEQGDRHEHNSSTSWKSRLKVYKATLILAYQSFGVVYGDMCTSPIFVCRNTFTWSLGYFQDDHEILGVLSLLFWTLTLFPLCKYAVFVLGADDNGEGGTFALYSLLCRHNKMGLVNSCYEVESEDSVKYYPDTRTSSLVKAFFEKHRSSRLVLLLVVLLGTSMFIVDGILTPSMSVLSAVSGLGIKHSNLDNSVIVVVACILLVGLFALQRCGTHKVGFMFAPILISWLLCISSVGVYNVFLWNPFVVKALSPYYILNFFRRSRQRAWSSLGGVFLCVTGTEAMFADLGHFSHLSVRVAFVVVVYPCLVLAYMGEAAYLSKNRSNLQHSFYRAIPEPIFWPVLVIATLATLVASQAIISAIFSIISQCRALSCFPRVKIIHTSNNIHGQIYIPEVNWTLMVLCLAVVVGLQDPYTIGNAYGMTVIVVMLVTTMLMFLVITTVWKRNLALAALFVLVFGSVELVYFTAYVARVLEGGWLPLVLSVIVLPLMYTWHYGTSLKRTFEAENKVSLETLLQLEPKRVPGICLVLTDLSSDSSVPPMFAHFVSNFPAFHRILVFVTLKPCMVPKVPAVDRFSICRVGPPEFSLFRCIVRVGYKDAEDSCEGFETRMIRKLHEFVMENVDEKRRGPGCCGSSDEEMKRVAETIDAGGTTYMMGRTRVLASPSSHLLKKLAVNYVYGFLRRSCRAPATCIRIPHTCFLQVGMVYRV